MTLIWQRVGSGPKRRCDARCYSAKNGRCRCICGGRNHGVGLQQARENTREMAEELLGQGIQVSAGVLELVPA